MSSFLNFPTEYYSAPFPGKGQDAFSISNFAISLVDGATPLDPSWPQDIAEFADIAAKSLTDGNWETAVLELQKLFPNSGYKRTAGAIRVFANGNSLEVGVIGDPVCLVKTADDVVEITDRTLRLLDERAEVSVDRDRALQDNRRLANQSGGYGILGTNLDTLERVHKRMFKTSDVQGLLLMSDGVWRKFSENPVELWQSLGTPRSLQATLERLKNEFDDDATCIRVIFSRP